MSLLPTADRPLVIVGTGPVGLAAAALAHERGLPVVVLEAGVSVARSVSEWGHVQLFSPWSELVDAAAARLLTSRGWSHPDPTGLPTGAQWVSDYLAPLAEALQSVGVSIRTDHQVVALPSELARGISQRGGAHPERRRGLRGATAGPKLCTTIQTFMAMR